MDQCVERVRELSPTQTTSLLVQKDKGNAAPDQ